LAGEPAKEFMGYYLLYMPPSKTATPAYADIEAELGSITEVWNRIIDEVSGSYGPIEQEWKASKSEFGQMCQLKQKKRTLVYLTPEKGQIRVAIVLGERAVDIALESRLPDEIKSLIREACPYVEGRGIRFAVASPDDVPTVLELVKIKTAPK
jgi:hypothetical protein